MEFTILAHIILGSILTISIIFTLFFLLRMLFTNNSNKAIFKARFGKSAIFTVVLFIVYMGWIFVKKTLF